MNVQTKNQAIKFIMSINTKAFNGLVAKKHCTAIVKDLVPKLTALELSVAIQQENRCITKNLSALFLPSCGNVLKNFLD